MHECIVLSAVMQTHETQYKLPHVPSAFIKSEQRFDSGYICTPEQCMEMALAPWRDMYGQFAVYKARDVSVVRQVILYILK